MLQRVRSTYRSHHDFILLAILAIFFRLMALFLFRPGGFIGDWSDYLTYLGSARVTDWGLYPYIDYWLEYPPLFPWLTVMVYRLSILFPPWVEPRLWFNTFLGLALLPFEIGNVVLVYLVALEIGDRAKALKCAWFYVCLFTPIYTWLGWFDNMPLFFLLLGLYLLLKQRAYSAGIAVGLGFMTKVIPVLLLPVGFRYLRGLTKKLGFAVAAEIAIFLIALPFLLINRGLFLFTAFRNFLTCSAWETFWAVADSYFLYGIVGGDRFDPWPDFSVFQSKIPWYWTAGITLAFALIYLWLYTRPQHREAKWQMVSFAGLTVNLFILYSKGYSPQFLAYILPFIVWLLPNLHGAVYMIVLTLSNFLEGALFFSIFPEEHWILVSAITFRTLAVLALCFEYGLLFFSLSSGRIAKVRDYAFSFLTVCLVLAGCVVSFRVIQTYFEVRYADEEYRAAMGFLRTQVPPPPRPSPKIRGGSNDGEAALVFTEQPLYYRFYPFLRKDLSLYVVKEADERLAGIAAKHDEIWLLCGPEAKPSVEDWLDDRFHRLANYRFGDDWLFRYSAQRNETLPLWIAELGGKVRLLSYQLGTSQVKAGGEVPLTLYWQALKEMDKSYTVFTHLVDDANRIWGQKDNPPASGMSPTSEWREGEVVEDSYVIPIQADAPQGTYRIIVGMYDPQTMQRLPVSGREGQEGDRVLLEEGILIGR